MISKIWKEKILENHCNDAKLFYIS